MQQRLAPDIALFFRDQLRSARAAVLRDSEAYDAVVLVIERLGRLLGGYNKSGLGAMTRTLSEVAAISPLAECIPSAHPEHHQTFGALFELLRQGRNAAVHEGAVARHLAVNALRISFVLEDALMTGANTIGDFMVRDPVVALPWQPLSMVRQQMLANSFSYLPVRIARDGAPAWSMISEIALAKFFRSAEGDERRRRMAVTLEDAVEKEGVALDVPLCLNGTARVADVLEKMSALPVLIVAAESGELIGIVTAFDLL